VSYAHDTAFCKPRARTDATPLLVKVAFGGSRPVSEWRYAEDTDL
jgi:hypothetical protein